MAYVSIITTVARLETDFPRNIIRVIDEYKVANSYIIFQDTEVPSQYPVYTIFSSEINSVITSHKGSQKTYSVSLQLDMDVTMEQGWKKASEMLDAVNAGFNAEEDNLYTARIRYLGYDTLSNEPLDINGEQILSKSVQLKFEVLL